ncbi:MAG: helix-turn-helix transcriptional regulator [Caulobacteraceae bacterium]
MLVLQAARAMAGTAEGLTLDELASELSVSRRTAERVRDAVAAIFPQMERTPSGASQRFRIAGGMDSFLQTPDPEELNALRQTIAQLREIGADDRTRALEGLQHKVLSALRSSALRRLEPDMEALARAERLAVQAGPRPFEDESLLAALRQALKSMKQVAFLYRGPGGAARRRVVTPFGIMFDRFNYLVGAEAGSREPKNWRLDRIDVLEVLDATGSPPPMFSLSDHASRSFGIFQDEVRHVRLRITPEGAEDAMKWRFHPTQTVTAQEDGSVVVEFRSAGMLELAWHLFTWGGKVRVLEPPELRRIYADALTHAAAAIAAD